MQEKKDSDIKLRWLFKLRTGTFLSSVAVFVLSSWGLGLDLSIYPFAVVLTLAAISNYGLYLLIQKKKGSYNLIVGSFLAIDLIWLTINLYFYGGYTNPFSTLYLFYITLAAFFLSSFWTWMTYTVSLVFFGVLFFFYLPVGEMEMHSHHHHAAGSGFSLHLQGMYVGFLVIGALLSYFLSKMSEEVNQAAELAKTLRERQAEERKLLGLASLTAGAAHELSTPIGTIKLISESLRENFASQSELVSEVDQIDSEIDRCEKVLKRMRLNGCDLPGEVVSLVSTQAIRDVLAEEFKDRKGRLIFTNFENDISFYSLSDSLVESLIALVKNAFEASAEDQSVELELQSKKDILGFIVRDSAKGIDSEIISRIGDPFVSTKSKGMGLGLFLVKLFARRIGAELDIESNSSGSIFALNILNPKYA